jgi:regulatory protein
MRKSRFEPKAGEQEEALVPADGSDRAKRLEYARALLEQSLKSPSQQPTRVVPRESSLTSSEAACSIAVSKSSKATRSFKSKKAFEALKPFEDADPFEPFEQCAPGDIASRDDASSASASASGEPVYTRTSQRARKPSAKEAGNARRPPRSLKGRALGYLSRREYSRAELSRRLKPYITENDSLDTLLDELERDGWLSNERFVESVVHRRAERMGGKRIISELKQHAVGDALISETAGKLAHTEVARARSVWEKKFGKTPETPAERAKQARFLAARGFSGSTIGKILKGGDDDLSDEFIDDE